jgi:glycosyltransferase involved in cell wall biosynthesis
MTESVMFVAPSAYPLGGVATWLDYLLPGLAGRGWRPILGLVAGVFHDVDRYRAAHPWSDCLGIENPTGTPEGRIRALMRVIRRVRPSLVAGVNIPDTYAAIGRMRANGESTPHVVMTNHSVEERYLEDANAWADVLDGLICTNRLGCRLAQQFGRLQHTRVHYAPYGVAVPTSVDREFHDSPILRVAYSGRLDEGQKRAGDIPQILAELERLGVNYEMLIAGGGPSEPALRARLQALIDAERVRFLGVLDYPTLVDRVYKQADILLVTSSWETGPIVAWEAMAHGLTVVTSRYIGSGLEGSLVHEKNCLMYPVGDVRAAATQVARATRSSLRRSLALAGYGLVRERYSCSRSVEAWDRSLRNVLASPARAATRPERSVAPSGRLDRVFGTAVAESVRRCLGRSYRHSEPGGEWPHVHSRIDGAEEGFWREASQCDRENVA